MRTLVGLVTSLVLAACAHTPRAALIAPKWPPPPQQARVVWASSFPDERAVEPERSAFRRVIDFIIGDDPGDPASPAILSRPFGVAVRGDTLFVADPDGHQVLAVKWADGRFERITCPALEWKAPMAVAVAADGALFVADSGTARVVRVRRDAKECAELGEGLVRPTGVALLGDRVFVVDPPQHAVFSFSQTGGAPARFGQHGEAEGELNFPTAVTATANGLLVVDALNWRIVSYSPSGEVTGAFGQAGTAGGAFGRPKAVAADAKGRVYVSDAQFGVILVFDEAGGFELAFGGSAREPQNLSLPAGLAIEGDQLFVADAYHHRVERYTLLEVPP